MGEARPVATVFVRHRGRVLLERTDAGFDGIVHPFADSVPATVETVAERIPAPDWEIVRAGEPIRVEGDPSDRQAVLVDLERRGPVAAGDGGWAWHHPTELVGASGAPGAWRAYRTVSPTVTGIVGDETHGSSTLSVAALQFLRDEAADGTSWTELEAAAKRLVDECGAFTALVTRVDRTMTRAVQAGSNPAALAGAAREELEEAVEADEEAATRAAEPCRGKTVLTISRSGTVLGTLSKAEPAEVIFLESRPNREGTAAAESLAVDGHDVSVVLDAAAGDVLCRRDVNLVLVGADSVDPNGDVRNKVGTRILATAAQAEEVPVIVVTASDKITDTHPPEAWVDGEAIYDGPADIDTACRLFDRTPPELVDELITEVGSVTPDITVWIAAERRRNRAWRERSERLQSA